MQSKQTIVSCLLFSCPAFSRPAFSCLAFSPLAISMVRQFHALLLGPSFSRLAFSCRVIWWSVIFTSCIFSRPEKVAIVEVVPVLFWALITRPIIHQPTNSTIPQRRSWSGPITHPFTKFEHTRSIGVWFYDDSTNSPVHFSMPQMRQWFLRMNAPNYAKFWQDIERSSLLPKFFYFSDTLLNFETMTSEV